MFSAIRNVCSNILACRDFYNKFKRVDAEEAEVLRQLGVPIYYNTRKGSQYATPGLWWGAPCSTKSRYRWYCLRGEKVGP